MCELVVGENCIEGKRGLGLKLWFGEFSRKFLV